MNEPNIVYIGQKPIMNYVLAVVKRFGTGASNVIIQARGRSISKAVDVALITMERTENGVKLSDISISTEVLPGPDGNPLNVSSIKISVEKP